MSSLKQRHIPLFIEPTAEVSQHTLIIAEIGVNHDGCPKKAVELLHAAHEAGADMVKFQLFHPDRLLSSQAQLAGYQAGKAADAYELLSSLTLSTQELTGILLEADRLGVMRAVTPFSLQDVDDLGQIGAGLVSAVKLASPDAVNGPLLSKAAGLGLPLLISTGTCELQELDYAAQMIRSHSVGGALLHCVSSYPTPLPEAGLKAIEVMRDRFGLPIGYSDHTQSVSTGAMAVCAGACVIEKHLTYDQNAAGPDHAASMEPSDFALYVKQIREAEVMMGLRFKGVREVERDVRLVSRQSVAAANVLTAGQVIESADLTVMRPGTGVPAMRFDEVIGKQIKIDKQVGELIHEEDVAW
ncbi:N,N'-diacetyllegionaminic acid synthase [Poriferisphaera corsica]|uniref:N,N'-diacetyllegionaminic acid synthase n=1 Tax=Poriferisphaera corsica TaxID=2528020 RepID=A0A517YRK2_9BACT|nr:N-acetylneuraminate synthase family protein [Poriferisphaera corsica]QDU32847.1 N,N'-diacetyllegionaminic acid synthase [Poriferisphaera corsica]